HQGRVLEFNRAAEQTFGYSTEEAIGREMAELIIPPSLRDAHRKGLKRYLETGYAVVIGKRLEITAMRADGTEFPVELTITRIDLEGPPTFTGFIRDISDRKKREEFDGYLAEAGALLGATLDVHEILEAVTRLAVPRIADWCAIDLLGDDGRIRRVAAAHTDPSKTELAYELARRWPAQLDDPFGFGKVIRTGEPEFVEQLPTGVIDPAMRDDEYRETVRSLGLGSMIMVPLRAPGGQVLGGLALTIGDGCGKGPAAAALTALVRYTLRAVTMHEHRPERVLALLNEAILRDRTDDRFCSAVFAVVEGEHGSLRVKLASGGHPLPL